MRLTTNLKQCYLIRYADDWVILTDSRENAEKLKKAEIYIDDSSLVTDHVMFSTVYPFPNGFLDTPEYILITAG